MSDGTLRDHKKHTLTELPDALSAQAALERLAAMPRVSGLVDWVWNIPASTVYFSREWMHLLQSSDEAVLGPGTGAWWGKVHEDDIIPLVNAARDLVEGRAEQYQSLFRIKRGDGSWAWLLSRGTITERRNGMVVLVEGSVTDVTFLRSDVKFRHGQAALESAPDLTVRLDRELASLKASPGIARAMSGKKNGRAVEDAADSARISPEQMSFLRASVETVFAEGRSVRERVTFPTSYGHGVTGEYYFWPEFDAGGKVASVMAQFRDLTDQVLAERRAELNETRLEALYRLTQMNNAPENEVLRFVIDSMVSLSGSQGGYIFLPHKFPGTKGRMIWGTGLMNLHDASSLTDDVFPVDMIQRITGDDGVTPVSILKNGNSLHPLHYSSLDSQFPIMRYMVTPVFDKERVVCIAAVCNKETDYTEADQQQFESFINGAWLLLRRHEFVRELERAKNAAEHASRAKDQFLANVSHELRTPLNGMLSMLQLLEMLPLDEQGQEYVRTASTAGQTLMSVISDILDSARMESGMAPLRYEPFDLIATVEDTLEVFRKSAADKGLSFDVVLDRSVPSPLIGDGARLRQILFNVVGNALKFTERGGIRVEVFLLPQNASATARVYFSVSDTGIGIPPEHQHSIFEPFTQIDSSSSRKHAGTGLGLNIVKRLVTLMDGGISVESEEGKGTTMHFSLCFGKTSAAKNCQSSAGRREAIDACGVLDILVAEDDPAGRFALQAFLKRLGHRPVCVDNGRAALEALRLHPFDCLFTDIQMPDIDGLELVSHIREGKASGIQPSEKTRALLQASLPGNHDTLMPVPDDTIVVTVSAHAMDGDKERFLRAGMDFYLSKPIIMKQLSEVLDDVCVRIVRRDAWKN